MRRFVAYILASLAIIFGIGVSFKPVATRINADLSYRSGSTISLRLDKRDDNTKDYSEDNCKEYAALVESRLVNYGVSDYKITVEGTRNINVTLTADNAKEYENIASLLSTNPIIEIANREGNASNDETEKAKEIQVRDEGETKWHSNSARLEFDGTTSIVVMPIPDGFKTKVEEMIKEAEKYEKTGKKSNDEEKKTPNSIVLWMNRAEGDSYPTDGKVTDPLLKRKVIYDQMNSTNFYYGTDKTAFQIRFTPTSSKVSDISDSYKSALYYKNLLNAVIADFDCVTTNIQSVAPTVENLLIFGDHVHIAMSSTFISLMIGFILICLILALFYRIGAVAIISTASLTAFLSFTIFVFFRPLFNIAALVGLISIFAMSIFIGILYNNYLHEELYKGRSLKKANFEASKKSTLVTVDTSVVAMILGICLYFIGGKTIASAGILLITFALLSLLINTFILKGFMWLITNNTSTQKQYKLFGVEPEKIPDLTKEEKQTYYGPYEKKDFTKKKKVSAIVFGSLTLVSVVGMIVFAATKGDTFNTANYYKTTNVLNLVLQNTEKSEPVSIDEIKTDYLAQVKNNGADLKYDTEIESYTYTEYIKENSETKTYYRYVYRINILETNVDANTFTYAGGASTNLSDALESCFEKLHPIDDISNSFYKANIYNLPGDIGLIFAASAISTITIGAYFWIRRNRLSRVLPVAGITLLSNVIGLGVVTLTRIPATPSMAISVACITGFTLLAAQYLMHKEKDLLRDERLRDVEVRKATIDKALRMGALPLINFGIIFSFATLTGLAIVNKTFSSVFLASTLGIVSSSLMLLTLYAPAANYLDLKLSKVKLPQVKIRKKKKVKVKSNEPEEAIFIGIND